MGFLILELKIINREGEELYSTKGGNIVAEYNERYSEGDKILISARMCEFISIKLDKTLMESIVYVPNGSFEFEIPFGTIKADYDSDAFCGDSHTISVKEAEGKAYEYRNIALNPYDRRGQKKYYPHAYANLVTREAPCFFERNAIDGVCDNSNHGDYPYHSWAGGAREDLEYYIDFGTDVEVDKIVFYLRADFPHDT